MSNLPSDLLHIIAQKLKEPADLIRLRSVCSHWRSALSLLSIPPPPLPWLFLCFRPDTCSCYFYSFSEDRIYRIRVPDIWSSVDFLNPSCYGWFPASKEKCDDGKYRSLLNLFTGGEIDLPTPLYQGMWFCDNLTRQNLMRVSPDCTSLWQVGKVSLKTFNNLLLAYAKSITYHENCLYIISQNNFSPIVIFDAQTLQIIGQIPVHLWEDKYFLAVTTHKFYILTVHLVIPLDLRVFAMDRNDKNQMWRRVTDIGNQAILLDRNRCFLVDAGPSTGLKENCVYFPLVRRPSKRRRDGQMNRRYCMTRVDLRDCSCEEVNCRLSSFIISDSWMKYSSVDNCSWIIPTLG